MSNNYTDPDMIPDMVLFTRIAEAIRWCAIVRQSQKSKATLRSRDLQPALLSGSRVDVVSDVVSTRHWKVADSLASPIQTMPSLEGGRLLCYFPDADLCDGAAEIASEGYFDAHNTPPWDTWVSYFQDGSDPVGCYDNYLLAYVPAQLVPLAVAGMMVNPEECVAWLHDVDVKLRSRVPPA